jgi:hypothetical protein
MPDINLPNVPFIDGFSPNGSQVSNALWDPQTTPQSFNVINGQLDQANLDSGFSLGFRQTKKGTFGRANFVGSTLNMDFFNEVFAGYRTTSWYYDPWSDGSNAGTSEKSVRLPGTTTDPQRNPYLAIPNAAIRFYMERAGSVMLTWHVMWVDDGDVQAGDLSDRKRQVTTPIRLFVDNEAQRAAYRLLPTETFAFPLGRQRYWNGHHFIENLAEGWHEAYLGICVPSKVPGGIPTDDLDTSGGDDTFYPVSTVFNQIIAQARVRARGMRAIRLR